MSWASVAQRKAKSIEPARIAVQYSTSPKLVINEKIDNIPRHKEKTPDPDNCFYHCGDDRYAMFFGFSDALDGLNWLIDYIFAQMSFCPDGYNNLKHQPELSKNDKTKVITQLLNYLKLLITNDIINVDDEYHESLTWDKTIWEKIRSYTCLLSSDDKLYSDDIMDGIADLIIACKKHDAILTIMNQTVIYNDEYNDDYIYDYRYRRMLEDKLYLQTIFYSRSGNGYYTHDPINNKHGIIEKLLFRGMLPFQIVDEKRAYTSTNEDEFTHHLPTTLNDGTKETIETLTIEANIYENVDANKKYFRSGSDILNYGYRRPSTQMIVLSQ